jgi:cardiolipin synthase
MEAFGRIDWSSLYLAAEWAIRIAALLFVPIRRSADAARAWLILLLLLPVPGLLLYLLIGRPSYPRRRRARLERARRLLTSASGEIAHSKACRQPSLPASFEQAALLIERLGRLPPLAGNKVELERGYDDIIARLIGDIDAARDHVHLLTYIFADDETGTRVIEALARAVRRGVECRVLVDSAGSRRWLPHVRAMLSEGGVSVAEALPLAPWRRGSARADLRNHRKLTIIDGRIGYIGSQNIVDARASRRIVNEEVVARVEGPIVTEMQALFAVDWLLETDEVISGSDHFAHQPTAGSVIAQLMPSGPDHGDALSQLTIALMHGARRRIAITTPYFIPEPALVQALRTAVLRGVEVVLILPARGDHLLVRLAQQSYYGELLDAGVSICSYVPRFLHAKHFSIDEDICQIGSSNVDVRSFMLNAEVSLLVYDRAVTQRLIAIEQSYIRSSTELTSETWARRSLAVKVAENLARLLGPLL